MTYAAWLSVVSGALLVGGLSLLWVAADPSFEYGFDYVGIDFPLGLAIPNALIVGTLAAMTCTWLRVSASVAVLLFGSWPTFFVSALVSGGGWGEEMESFNIGSSAPGFLLWIGYCALCGAVSVLVVWLRQLDTPRDSSHHDMEEGSK